MLCNNSIFFSRCTCLHRIRPQNRFNFLHALSTWHSENEIPVIRIPKYLENNLGNSIYKEHIKVKRSKAKWNKATLNPKHMNKLIISWTGDKKLNHYYGYRYDPEKVPLISKEWLRERTIGDRMTFHSFDGNPSLFETTNDQKGPSFESLGLNENIVRSINGIVDNSNPSSIQYGVIPAILENKNVIFSAETGSGKTIAYLAPIIQMIEQEKRLCDANRFKRSPFALVILPSRELSEQVGKVAMQLTSYTDVGVAIMIGGMPKNLSHSGLDLVVTTMGIIESHLERRIYSLNRLNHIVLDEADTLLDDTFSNEAICLLENLNLNTRIDATVGPDDADRAANFNSAGTKLICASATMPSNLDSSIGKLLDLEEDVEKITTTSLHCLSPNVKHIFYRLNRYEKDLKLIELLKEMLRKKKPTIVFANRGKAVDWIYHFLNENDIRCTRLNAEMSEEERYHAFNAFQNEEFDILVATDLGSRGLDTTRVRHVINFDCPHYVSDYIHRAGRTGRLGCKDACHVSTFVAYKLDVYMLMQMEKAIRLGKPMECADADLKSEKYNKRADKWNKANRDLIHHSHS